ncbi:MAG: NAD(+) synthase, partial [Planctomycetaceae bacterium]|nr:NAD(+) synthase [Planctomycetaceae bacterium]
NRPGHKLAQRGVDIILNPSASHFAFGKNRVRRGFVLEGSRSLHVSYIYANLLGNEAGRAVYDRDALIPRGGEMLVPGPRCSSRDTLLSTPLIDVARTRLSREQDAGDKLAVRDDSGSCLVVPFDFQEAARGAGETVELPAWEKSSGIKEEEFTRAVALGLLDYLRKSRSHGFVVSLSGGADSATVAVLVAMMARLTCQEIGADGLTEKLAYLPDAENLTDSEQWIHRLLACVYQATRNSSETTRTAAESVAEALGAEFFAFDVDQLVEGYVDTVSTAIGRPLNWDDDDLALQNIQARARAPGVWLLANLRNALLLATSNRSEAAVGYTTMDGDTCGGISPIAGIDKAFLRDWLRWMETDGPSGLGPVPELAAVNEQQPTAELRPPAQGQTDESDLMPYTVLDAIERLAIRDKLSPLEIFKQFQADAQMETAGYTHQQLFDWTRRFFQLWSRNQWKRERFAPSFHLDDENLDPKTWCRFPILSGGFERELADLEAFYQVGQLPGDNEG